MKGNTRKQNILATTAGIAVVGGIIGIVAGFLQYFGNPGNMGICVACFERDIAGALGMHKTAAVQYLRPEVMGLGLGSFGLAFIFGEFRSRGGSSPLTRFVLGMIAAIGTLVFLGCPWRTLLRLAGGDGNALFGLLGLCSGIFGATLFMRAGYSLGRSKGQPAILGTIFPVVLGALVLFRFIFPPINDGPQSGLLWYSLKGPGAQHAEVLTSLAGGLIIGALAQRSRFCTMGAFRDIFLFKQGHLFTGVITLVLAALATNIALGQFHPGFEGQPIAHTDGLWNFLGMVVAGMAFAFAGGCPGRQLFLGGEGDIDAAVFALGLLVGTAVAHNFGTASSGAGVGPNGPLAVGISFAMLLAIGFFFSRKKV